MPNTYYAAKAARKVRGYLASQGEAVTLVQPAPLGGTATETTLQSLVQPLSAAQVNDLYLEGVDNVSDAQPHRFYFSGDLATIRPGWLVACGAGYFRIVSAVKERLAGLDVFWEAIGVWESQPPEPQEPAPPSENLPYFAARYFSPRYYPI